jgi:hypothetical protein
MHFSSRRNKGLHLIQQVDGPAIAALSTADIAIESDESVFVEDFSLEHSSPGGTVSAVVIVANLGDAQMPETQKGTPQFVKQRPDLLRR